MTASREAERLVTDIKAVVRDAEHLLETGGSELNKAARDKLEKAIAAARQSCQSAEESMKKALEETSRCVRNHPWESIGVALGVGLLVGILFRKS